MAKISSKLNALIDRYYERLAEFKHQYALHEGAVSEAFQTLLADAARPHHWTLIPQLTDKKAGKHIRPDGTFKDIFGLVRGNWEAKKPRMISPKKSPRRPRRAIHSATSSSKTLADRL